MTGEIRAMVKKMVKFVRTGSTEVITGDAKDQRAEELKHCSELGTLCRWNRDKCNEVTEDTGHIAVRRRELRYGCW